MTRPVEPAERVPAAPGPGPSRPAGFRAGGDTVFLAACGLVGGVYLLLLAALLVADLLFTSPAHVAAALAQPEIRHAIRLTLGSCTIAALVSVVLALPLAYLLARQPFPGRGFVEPLLDLPLVLPPLVLGLSLLILFNLPLGGASIEDRLERALGLRISYTPAAVVLAQVVVTAAFATQSLRATFERIDPRPERVALTLGCRRDQAFRLVLLPQAWRGILVAFTTAWARALGEFGPILVFAGATRMRTEVLSTAVFLELGGGRLEAAVAVSLVMVAAAVAVLGLVRLLGARVAP